MTNRIPLYKVESTENEMEDSVGIFGKKQNDLKPGAVWATEPVITPAVDFDSVIDWLVGLSDEDYKKVCDVAAIYRKAAQEAAGTLGVANEATTFITPPETEDLDFEDMDIPFIEDEPKKKATKKNAKA